MDPRSVDIESWLELEHDKRERQYDVTTSTESSDSTATDTHEETLIDNCIGDPDLEFCDTLNHTDVEVTLHDVAQFAPDHDVASMEPNGWAIVGLPANFYGSSDPQIVDGELFGAAVQVRFTPTAWAWDYGDGTSATSTTAGASWKTLGQDEFTETATSHQFVARGTYAVQSSVGYTVAYRFAGMDWAPIDGTLTIATDRFEVLAGQAQTVLVAGNCRDRPDGPGC